MATPTFDLLILYSSSGEGLSLEVPKEVIGLVYKVNSELKVIESPAEETLLWFATTSLLQKVCVSRNTGRVVQFTDHEGIEVVNSSLEAFVSCARCDRSVSLL
jgi:SUKH-4 immunity protein of toxin-antitoxin system